MKEMARKRLRRMRSMPSRAVNWDRLSMEMIVVYRFGWIFGFGIGKSLTRSCFAGPECMCWDSSPGY